MMKRDTFLNLKYLFLNREDKIRYMKEILSACQTVLLLSLYLQPQISLRYLFDVCLSLKLRTFLIISSVWKYQHTQMYKILMFIYLVLEQN